MSAGRAGTIKPQTMMLALLVGLSSCSTSTSDLEKQSSTRSETRTYGENYQEIYRRIYQEASRCATGALSATASMNVDAQLYSELHYGEITLSLVNVGVRNYYWKAKIEKREMGSRLTVFSGNTLNNATWLKKVFGWAEGKVGC